MTAKAARRVEDHLPDSEGYPRWSFQVELSDADVIQVSKGEMPASVFPQLQHEVTESIKYVRSKGMLWFSGAEEGQV